MPEFLLTLKLDDKDYKVKIISDSEDAEKLRKKFSETGNETGKTINELKNKYANLQAAFDRTEIGSSQFKKLKAEIDKTKTAIDQASGSVEGIGNKFSQLGGYVAGAASLAVAVGYVNASIDKAGEMEGYKTSLKVMLGGTDQAQRRLEELIEFAANTPYEIPQVVQLGNQLQAVGRYSKQTMTDLGDLAAAANKPLEQVAGAYSKLASGQKGIGVDMFRDLLITTQDWVEATGKGVSKTGELKATTEEMLAAIPKILEKKHFSGMMEEQSKTMKGQLSNMADAAGQLQTEFGNALMPFVKGVTSMAIPTLTGLKGNVDLIISVVKVGTITFVAYEVAVNGVAIAQKVAAVSTELLKKAQDALKASMAGNPIGLIVVALTAAAVAAYELNEAYGNTIENQKKWNEEAQKLNETEQKRISTQIEAKKKTGDVAAEYERLYKAYQKTKEGTDEHKKAEDKLHGILVEQQKIYPGLITNTFDYAGNVDKMKTAANQAVGDIEKLTGELTKQQKALLDLKLAADDIALDQASKELLDSLGMFGAGSNDFNVFSKIDRDMRSGKRSLTEIKTEVEGLMSKYSSWAAMGGDNKSYNIDKANALNELLKAINSKVDDYNLKVAGKGIDAKVDPEDPNKNKNKNGGDTDTSFADKKKKALEDLKKNELEKQQISENATLDYLALAEKKETKEAELAEIHKKIKDTTNEKDLEKYLNEKDLAEKSIKLLDDQMKKEEDNLAREMDIHRKRLDDNVKANNDEYKANEEKIKKELELQKMRADAISDEYEREYALLDAWRMQELDKYANDAQAKALIDEVYFNKKVDLKKKELMENNVYAETMIVGYRTMMQNVLRTDMTGAEKRKAIWDSMQDYVYQLLVKELEDYIMTKAAELFIHETTEAEKTATTEAGTAARLISLASEIGKTLLAAGASIVGAVASAIEWEIATFGPFAIATIPASIAAIYGLYEGVKAVFGFDQGGRLRKGEPGYFEGRRDEIIAPEKNFIGVVNDLIASKQIAARESGINEAVFAVDRKLAALNFDIANTGNSNNKEVTRAMDNLSKKIDKLAENPFVLDDSAVVKIYNRGRKLAGYKT